MALGMEVGLGPGDFALDGDLALPEKKYSPTHQIFGPCLLWPNGWMMTTPLGTKELLLDLATPLSFICLPATHTCVHKSRNER